MHCGQTAINGRTLSSLAVSIDIGLAAFEQWRTNPIHISAPASKTVRDRRYYETLLEAIGLTDFQNLQKIDRMTLTGHLKVMKVKIERSILTVAPMSLMPIDKIVHRCPLSKCHDLDVMT